MTSPRRDFYGTITSFKTNSDEQKFPVNDTSFKASFAHSFKGSNVGRILSSFTGALVGGVIGAFAGSASGAAITGPFAAIGGIVGGVMGGIAGMGLGAFSGWVGFEYGYSKHFYKRNPIAGVIPPIFGGTVGGILGIPAASTMGATATAFGVGLPILAGAGTCAATAIIGMGIGQLFRFFKDEHKKQGPTVQNTNDGVSTSALRK